VTMGSMKSMLALPATVWDSDVLGHLWVIDTDMESVESG
jgi:hypothetical protein